MEKKLEKYAMSLGFDIVGFTSGKLPAKYKKAYEKWIEKGYEADMGYMRKARVESKNSVIVLGKNYYREQQPPKKNHGKIARYAYGRDYHKVIGKALKKLEIYIKKLEPKAETRAYTDTGPVLERAYAREAGLGFTGKNSCLITPEFGSWIFLAVIFTNLSLRKSANSIKISCGTCTRCMDACPTGAIIAPGVIDANKCISYHTIENKGKVPSEIAEQIGKTKRIFGCDICQEVCPHNLARQKVSKNAYGKKGFFGEAIAGEELTEKSIPDTDKKFLSRFAGSPLMRGKREGLKRNLAMMKDRTAR